MLRVGVLGATGRVGRLLLSAIVQAEDLSLAAAVTRAGSSLIGVDAGVLAGLPPADRALTALGPGCFDRCDVVVDFSLPEGLAEALPLLGNTALVTGTTGLDAAQEHALTAQASAAPVLTAANFSSGVTVLGDLVARAAKALPDYDVEVVEAHHRRKIDAPSGTALYLARAAAVARGQDLDEVAVYGREGRTGARPSGQIGIHALRGGDVVGEHTVWLAGEGDRLLLGHVATSRDTFAHGALRAARWLHGKPAGHYAMTDVLGLR